MDTTTYVASVTGSERPQQPAQAETRRPEWGRFAWHFVEMVAAMLVGMFALGAVVNAVFGRFDLLQREDVSALVMATEMAIGMSLWMWYRKHSWASIAEMSAAMYVPFAVLLVPFWAGLLPGHVVMMGGHGLMLPAMIVAMLRRRGEYAHDHAAAVSAQA